MVVEVRPGESAGAVAATLARRGVIGSTLAFRLSLLVHGTPTLQPGGYLFRSNESFSTVRSIMGAGPTVVVVDVAAGQHPGRGGQRAARVLPGAPGVGLRGRGASAGAVTSPYATPSSPNLEGLLGHRAVPGAAGGDRPPAAHPDGDRFNAQATQAGLTPAAAAAHGLTPYQVVTVASIAQKEGYYERYFGPVARVIYNRLARGMTLDMTSTVLYALDQDGGPVSAADQKVNSPYNTYLHSGLTPTPICFPSEAALAAAVSPPAGTWLYFTVVVQVRHNRLRRHLHTAAGQREAGPEPGSRLVARGERPSGGSWPSAATTLVGVIGDPVAHSLSPLIHNTAFAVLGLDWVSVGFVVPAGSAAGGGRRAGPRLPGCR